MMKSEMTMEIEMADERDILPATILEGMKAGKILLVDVREPAEFANERIHGAFLHPLSTFEPRAIPVHGARQVIFQCGSGKRSREALDRFLSVTGDDAAHMAGGIGAWKSAGLPVVKIDPSTGQVEDHGHF